MPEAAHKPQLAHKKNIIFGVGGVVYQYDKQGRLSVLLIKKQGGYWTLPKGKLKPEEHEVEALAREVAEETGLTGDIGAPVHTVSYKILKRGALRRKQVAYYLVQARDGTLSPNHDERIMRANWFTPRAAIRRIKRRRIRAILALALEQLRQAQDARESAPSQTQRNENGESEFP
jgi:8-oxo-dGTP pyrophosphatase MutT (NUDIX family)